MPKGVIVVQHFHEEPGLTWGCFLLQKDFGIINSEFDNRPQYIVVVSGFT